MCIPPHPEVANLRFYVWYLSIHICLYTKQLIPNKDPLYTLPKKVIIHVIVAFKKIIPVCLHIGADVHKGKYWDTPLHAAAQQPSTDIVNLLIEFGADINAKNIELLRPVDMATSNGAVERVLLQHEGRENICKCL